MLPANPCARFERWRKAEEDCLHPAYSPAVPIPSGTVLTQAVCGNFVPTIGCRQLELGHPLWMIVENEVHQLVGEVSENGVQRKQDRLGQHAGLIPCQVLHPNAEIAALCMAEARPSFHKAECHCAWGLSARPHAAAQFCSHTAIGLVVLALPVACSGQNVFGIRIRGLGA